MKNHENGSYARAIYKKKKHDTDIASYCKEGSTQVSEGKTHAETVGATAVDKKCRHIIEKIKKQDVCR